MDAMIKNLPAIKSVLQRQVTLPAPFEVAARRFAKVEGTVVLLSGGDLDCARYHILAAKPWMVIRGYGRQMRLVVNDRATRFEADPFALLQRVLDKCRLEGADLPKPLAAGLCGYLSYDLKDHLEKLPRTTLNDSELPDVCLFAPSEMVIHDTEIGDTRLIMPLRNDLNRSQAKKNLDSLEHKLKSSVLDSGEFSTNGKEIRSGFPRPVYEAAVRTIKDYIAAGDVYQVNMSQRFELTFRGDPFAFFYALYNNNPAPFYAYVNAGDHQVVSTSPERFLQLNGNRVETRPIKGTRPRGKSAAEDQKNREELIRSKKDDAELSMIVDLLRNDLGRVCVPGSVKVSEHKRLEAYQNVYHLVSIVVGELASGKDAVDLIRATFPGGSITGCPKIRAMEIIDELEPVCRHVYTGAMGYIGFDGTMDLNIAIRTAVIQNGKLHFNVGGGVVFDSDPGEEYEETLHKGRTLMTVLNERSKTIPPTRPFAWVNGVIKPLDDATIGITAPGFQYGHGFFETIRAINGHCPLLKDHIHRFQSTWKHLMPNRPPELSWDTIIARVLEKNRLTASNAAIKIIAAHGEQEKPPFNHTVVVTARSYTHRLEALRVSGLRLITYPQARQSPLADHKTLNYLYYHLAGRWAKSKGADEALILNPDGTLSETNTANLLLLKGRTVLRPTSSHVLPGVMEQAVAKALVSRGFVIQSAVLKPEDLFRQDEVWLTNALMGAVSVLALDRLELPPLSDVCRQINQSVWGQPES